MDLVQAENENSNKNIKPDFKLYNRQRLIIVMSGITIIMAVFCVRLFDWQILNNDVFTQRAAEANTYFIKTDAVRGEIFSSDETAFAVNNSSYKVEIERLEVPDGKENELIIKTLSFLKKLGNDFKSTLPIYQLENGLFEFCEYKDIQIKILKRLLKLNDDATAINCLEALAKKFNCEEFDPQAQYKISAVKYNNFKAGINSKAAPILICDNIDEKTMVILSECLPRLPGIRIASSFTRSYPNGNLAPHIVGYTGYISNEEYEKHKDEYSIDSIVGKIGAESSFEETLRGYSGKRGIQLARDNSVINSSQIYEAKPGNSIILTLSSKLQACANESLERNIKAAKNAGAKDCYSGAAVVIDLKDFGILAASTYPTYDIQEYIKNNDYHNEITSDKMAPLLNRAFNGCYAPGSVFKPMVACAALEEGCVTPDEKIKCNGAYTHYKGYTLHCMGVHGNIDLKPAIAKSCNVFFAELGRRLGAEKMKFYANKLGLGVKTGVEISENEGTIATPERGKWYVSTPSQAAIGQADTNLTPLGLAVYAGSIAIGKRFKTHILKQVRDYTLKDIIYEYEPEVIEENIISDKNLNIVRECMKEVTISGTASNFRNFFIPIAAKTGTAQNKGSDHTLFICYAPFDKPEIAISVIIGNGVSGSFSKNVAIDLLKCKFKS